MASGDLQTLLDYYSGKLVVQYRTQPKAIATIQILVKQAIADNFLQQLNECFDIDTAVGPQLDILGKYVGVTRYLGTPDNSLYFGFWDYTVSDPDDQNPNGFVDYTDSSTNAQGIFYQYQFSGQANTALPDGTYRLILKMKIILNHTNMTLANIQAYIAMFFPDFVTVVDNLDMSLTYSVSASLPLSVDLLEAFLPKPMGVAITVNIV